MLSIRWQHCAHLGGRAAADRPGRRLSSDVGRSRCAAGGREELSPGNLGFTLPFVHAVGMTTLRRQLPRELALRGRSPRTRESYERAVAGLAPSRHEHRSATSCMGSPSPSRSGGSLPLRPVRRPRPSAPFQPPACPPQGPPPAPRRLWLRRPLARDRPGPERYSPPTGAPPFPHSASFNSGASAGLDLPSSLPVVCTPSPAPTPPGGSTA